MKRNKSSTTAKGTAALRAIESERSADERICYDPFARKFISTAFYLMVKWSSSYMKSVTPGASGFVISRCRYFDDYFDQSVKSGINQLVILGAGLDSRGYRDTLREANVRVFEVDHPATQKHKIALVRRVTGETPAALSYVPVDFEHESLDKLLSFGFEKSSKTLFIWEGVTCYLTSDAVDSTLSWIRTHAAKGSAVIFDYLYTSSLTSKDLKGMQRYHRRINEGLVFGIERGTIETFLSQRGFSNVVNVDAKKLEEMYCTGKNQGRKVADIYATVHAEV